MSARLLTFIPSTSPSMRFEDSRVVPFFTRREFDGRILARDCEAYERWLLRKWSLPAGAPLEEPPLIEFGLSAVIEHSLRWRRRPFHTFETVLRVAPPHPLRRIGGWGLRAVDRLMNGLQTAVLVYFTSLGLAAFPLLARGQWVGGMVMATVGSVFGSLLILQVRSASRRFCLNARTQLLRELKERKPLALVR